MSPKRSSGLVSVLCVRQKERDKKDERKKEEELWMDWPQITHGVAGFHSGAVCIACCIHQSLEEACKHTSSNDVMQTMVWCHVYAVGPFVGKNYMINYLNQSSLKGC